MHAVPWRVKVAAKMLLSRIPVGYGFWRGVGLFRHGAMAEPAYAHEVFESHFRRAELPLGSSSFTVLELGPGDSLFSAMLAYAHGASLCYLVDVGSFARLALKSYETMATYMSDRGLSTPDMESLDSVDSLLDACRARYETSGLSSLRRIPSGSVDFTWSSAVLEHIRRSQFEDTLCELRRITSPAGVSSHRVDLRDHLGEALNNLRFSSRSWESEFMANSGFYTNRIRYSEMLAAFKRAGFVPEVISVERWASLPTPRPKMSPEFAHLPDEDLCVSVFDVVLRPSGSSG